MLYLEDYLEKLELLPETLRKNMAEMRELDLCVENSMDKVKKNLDDLFLKANEMDSDELQANFQAIMKQGETSVEESEKKCQLANDMESLLSKYVTNINKEIKKFSTHLEANYSNINRTNNEVIDVDVDSNQCGSLQQSSNLPASSSVSIVDLVSPSSVNLQNVSENTLDHSVTDGLPVVINEPQTADTHQFSHIHKTRKVTKKLNRKKKRRKMKRTTTSKRSRKNEELHIDSDEPRYCICNEVSFGTMVACDHKMCLFEWFHFECVGLKSHPKGRWYCPLCIEKMKNQRLHIS